MTPANRMPFVAKYARALGVVAVTVLFYLLQVITDGMDAQDWVYMVGTGVAASGVALVPNLDEGIARFAKPIVAFLLAGLAVLGVAVLDGLTGAEMIEVIVASLAAVGVTALPSPWPPATLPRRVNGTGVSAQSSPQANPDVPQQGRFE